MSLAVGFREVVKRFGPVQVLHGVSFELEPGRVYGVLGENGAGKSTLMKILAGYEVASEGSVELDGREVAFKGPRDAETAGVVMIHQEFNLADDLTIAQNMYLGHEPRQRGLLDERKMARDAAELLRLVGLDCNPNRRVADLIVAEKQLVEIAKALGRRARVLVMDEPTATLTPSEAERLFGLIAQMKAAGTTIVYISHKLDEVERITDEVIVMRDGRFVARRPTADVTRQ
jgi:ribose transport system ATP-binding protein